MLSKPFGMLLMVLAISPALAQLPSTASSPMEALQFIQQNAPMRFRGLLSDGSVTSDNWSGYAVTGTAFTDAKGSWIVPKANCSKSPNGYAAFWVGIDGYSSTTVEQAGTLIFCNNTTPQYYSWYEFYPAEAIQLVSTVPETPGNKIDAEISYNGTQFTLKLTNETTGKSFTKVGKSATAKRSSAEWIAEAPSSSSGVLPLADFGVVSYGEDHTKINDTDWATDSKVTGPISDFGTGVEKITMISSKKVNEAVPSALSTDGSSFTVAWKSE